MSLTPESLADVMGNSLSLARYRELLPAMTAAMLAAECTTVNRAAAWHAQVGHEGGGLKYMAEIQTSDPSWNADRTRYRGRGPIQLTWSGNYRKFGQWCAANGYIDNPELFVEQPELVEQPKWGFLAASWYWLNGGPRPGQINTFADRGDIVAVSRCVNGWFENRLPNGMPDRQARWDRALAMGDAIVPSSSTPATTPTSGGTAVGFTGDPVWLEDVLREALGDRLVVEDGWEDTGTGGTMGTIWGVMIHHTGNSRESVAGIRDGRPDLAGPLSNCLITPDGKCYLIAVGPCNHSGVGSYPGIPTNNGNRVLIGFECAWPTIHDDGSYNEAERWPDAQIITMRDATAAVLKRLGVGSNRVIGHKEYAGAAQGKWDPGNMDMNWFRGEVAKDLRGEFDPKPTPQPSDPVQQPAPGTPGNPTTPPILPPPDNPRTDRVLLTEIWDQVRVLWPQLGDKTLVDYNAELGRKVDQLTAKVDLLLARLEPSTPTGQDVKQ